MKFSSGLEISELIANGGFGAVYERQDEIHGKVAIKQRCNYSFDLSSLVNITSLFSDSVEFIKQEHAGRLASDAGVSLAWTLRRAAREFLKRQQKQTGGTAQVVVLGRKRRA